MDSSKFDKEMAGIRSKTVRALQRRKSLLSTTLLSSSSVRWRLNTRGNSLFTSEALAAMESQSRSEMANNHRTCASITAFQVQDPDPNAVDGGRVFGLRIDVFSSSKRQFHMPYYLLFNRTDDGTFKLHKHTIPTSVPLPALLQRHMEAAHSLENLQALARAVRRELVTHVKRVEVVEKWKTEVARSSQSSRSSNGLVRLDACDATSNLVEIEFSTGDVAKIGMQDGQKVDKIAVKANSGIPPRDLRRRVDQALATGGGSFDGLLGRLMQES